MAANRVADMTVEELRSLIKDAFREIVQESNGDSLKPEKTAITNRPPLNLPLHDVGPWPENLSLRREDIYDEQF